MNRRLLIATFFVSFCVGAIAGCTCAVPDSGGVMFACDTQADCLAGERCDNRLCVPLDGGAGGGAGGGLGGGAGGGTGDGGTCGSTVEVCGDMVDDNCNGVLDDGCPCVGASQPCYPYPGGLSSPTLRYPYDGGAGCAPGTQACVGGVLAAACVNAHVPQLEFCDGQDTDCDGNPDPPPPLCTCQETKACYLGPPGTINADPGGTSICAPGVWANCASTPACQGQVLPAAAEACNGLDDDCNGLVDDNADTPSCGPGVCDSVKQACVGGAPVACNLAANPPPGYSVSEVCNDGLDNNCNGMVDEGCLCTLDAGVPCWTGASSACPADGGACQGVCRRGTQRCVALADGGTGYSSCTGQTLPSTEQCSDSQDNDCDGDTDCQDAYCSGRTCGSNGRQCSGNTCSCSGNGGTPQANETTCTDGHDNDCDGLTDCAESFCAGKACGGNGRTCVGTTCSCVVDGGTAEASETICNDGRDNDCDGLTDCAEGACASQACGPFGRTCSTGLCNCSGNGGPAQATETTCNDTFDNDCDGQTDCADSNCATAMNCVDAGPPPMDAGTGPEICNDTIDNDGDGNADCADSECFHKVCGSDSSSVCCGTTCTSLRTSSNCGQCGLSCPGGGACVNVGSGSHLSGSCACPNGMTSECPKPAGFSQQTCISGKCTCDGNDDRCGNASVGQGSRCYGASPDYCHYN